MKQCIPMKLIPAFCLLAVLAIDTAAVQAQGLVTGYGSGIQNRYPLRSGRTQQSNTGSWGRHYPAYYYGNRSINRPMVYNSRWYQKHIKPSFPPTYSSGYAPVYHAPATYYYTH